MAKITFIILAHENASHTADLARVLTDWDEGAHAVIHYDLKSPAAEFAKLKAEFANSNKVHFVRERIKCGWGDFSLVDATVRALKVIRRDKIECDRVMLVSGACMPIRPLKELSEFLDAHPKTEFIESFDASWITGGLRHERYQYWHFFNFQTQQGLFRNHYNLQSKIWPKRKFPKGLEPRFGSQWWCLSWTLCSKILDYVKKHPLVYFFFSTTWIPDELFFQTLAHKYTSDENLARRNLTFFRFNDWGKPLVFLDDHFDMLRQLPYFFARKISFRATELRARLKSIAAAPAPQNAPELNFNTPYTFPYKEALAALPRAAVGTPTLFQYREKEGWNLALEHCQKSFAILYGPPQLTKRAADVLRASTELTVLGRILNRDMVDLGDGRDSLDGLRQIDGNIRDMSIPDYFNRILARCETLPVFELCPGDDPSSEIALLESRNAIVMPVVPGTFDETMQQIYWILCAPYTTARLEKPEENSSISIFLSMLNAVDASVSREYREKIATYIKSATSSKSVSTSYWRTALEFQHGPAAGPLADAYDSMSEAVKSTTMTQIASSMPSDWKDSISTLASLDPDWRILQLNLPVSLQEFWTTAMQLQVTTAMQLQMLSPTKQKPVTPAPKK